MAYMKSVIIIFRPLLCTSPAYKNCLQWLNKRSHPSLNYATSKYKKKINQTNKKTLHRTSI